MKVNELLPVDAANATLIARVWDPEVQAGRVGVVRGDTVVDLSHAIDTVSDLLDAEDPAGLVSELESHVSWPLAGLLAAGAAGDTAQPHLLAPLDLQAVKACGVTFVDSMVERVIEERCAGEPSAAAAVRREVSAAIGGDLASLVPGSEAAAEAKRVLQEKGFWSQYLEVGIGPDPEVFSKAQVLASVGAGADIGVPEASAWNNPEPELVLSVNSRGEIRGAMLGNDVNLRDVEGRSALLLGKAKDNNASSAIGPFLRLFDDQFTLDSVRNEEISLRVEGRNGFVMDGVNSVGRISRTFEELVAATMGIDHQYPDGFVLFTGTLFAPTEDRSKPGLGFTHEYGDRVTIRSPHLGTLQNTVRKMADIQPWTFGIREFIAGQRRILATR